MTATRRTPTGFTSSDASESLSVACEEVGLSSKDAQLVRLGENAIYRLASDPVIVRIARSMDVLVDVKKEVAVASWLRDAGLPAAQTTEHPQPMIARERPVTFWCLIDDSGSKASVADLAQILRQLHSLTVPKELSLPRFDIFGRASQRISQASVLSPAERNFLNGRLSDLEEEYANLEFSMQPTAIHGDAHQSNLIQTPSGRVFLIDFEAFAFGPPEYDLSVTATEHMVGWHTDEQYADFARTYGFDVKKWDGFPVIRAINELKMTTWLMQNVDESSSVATEFYTRLASLHDDQAPRRWNPF